MMDTRHGTIHGYNMQGCRCDLCRKAIRDWRRDHRARTHTYTPQPAGYPDGLDWSPVVGYEGLYEVSSTGLVRGLDRVSWYGPNKEYRQFFPGKLIRQSIGGSGHSRRMQAGISKDGKYRKRPIHRLVLEAFVGPCPDGMEGCHNDGDAFNNDLSNLRWDTHAENMRDTLTRGTHPWARRTECGQGHKYTPDNTRLNPKGARVCRTCAAVSDRATKQRKRERGALAS